MSSTASKLFNTSKLVSNALGLVHREIPNNIWRYLLKNYEEDFDALIQQETTEKKKAKLTYAKDLKELIELVLGNESGPAAMRLCSDPIPLQFSKTVLKGNAFDNSGEHEPLKTDLVPYFQFHLSDELKYSVTGVGGWSSADTTDFDNATEDECTLFVGSRNPNSAINTALKQGRIAEIDLVCTAGKESHKTGLDASSSTNANSSNNSNYAPFAIGVKLAGTTILTTMLSRIAQRKKAGARKFEYVILYVAKDARGNAPLEGIARRLGFEDVTVYQKLNNTFRTARDGGEVRKYFILRDALVGTKSWDEKVQEALKYDSLMRQFCPVVARTGKSYCF